MASDTEVWVPVLPSFKDFAKGMDSGTKGAGTKVGERVGREIASGVEKSKAAVEKATEVAERAHNRVADAAGKVRVAEEQLTRARASGDSVKVARAEEQLATAKRRVAEASTAAENADKSLTTKRDRLTKATDDSTSAARENSRAVEAGEGSMSSMGGAADGLVGKLGGLATGLAGVTASVDTMMEGLDQDRLGDKLAAQLGATPEMAAEFGDMAGSLYAQAYGDSFEDVNDALRGVWQQGLVDEDATNAQIESITAKVLDLTTAFDQDLAGATGAIGTMLKTGLAPDADAAMDILTRGFQQGADLAGDLLDTMTEYPALFQALGIDGQTATGLIAQGMAGGARSADLVADALKEFQIRAIDGSKASAEAYGAIGLNAEEMTAKIAAGGEGAREGLDQVLDGLRAMEDPVERNAAAVGLFGTQAEDLGGALFDLDPSTAVQALGDVGGAAEEMGNTLNDNAATRLEAFKRSAQQFAIDSAGGFIGWVSENIDLLKDLGIVLGVTAIALGGVAIASGILTAGSLLTWVRNLTIAQWLLNSAMLANPWTWVVLAIAGLVAAFVILWNKSEAFRGFWIGLWDSIKNAAAWAWQNVIKPVWDAMKVALSALGAFFGWVWTALIKPAWDALGAGISWVWNAIIRPAWDALKAALGAVGAFFGWVWNSVIKPTWDALGAGIAWVWENVIRPNWDALKWALGAVGDFFSWVWNSVIRPAWDALGAGIRWVWDNVVNPVFEGIKRGLDLVRSAFRTAVDIIGSVWNEMREKTAAPIRFVIDTVYNKGIVAVWNKVAGWLGMDDKTLDPMPLTFASGGVLPGYTPGRDVHKFVNPATGQGLHLSGGEAIMRPEWTRAIGGPAEVERQNKLAMSGQIRHGRESAAFADGGVLAFAGGGIVDAMTRIVQAKYPMLQMTSGYRASNDLHGQGMAGDFSNGSGNTPAQLALANDIADTYPGSMELIYDSPGFDRTIKNGSVVGPFGQFYTWGQAGNHQHHVHWAMNTPPTMPFGGGVFEGGSDGSGGGGRTGIIGGLVRGAMDKIMDPIMDLVPTGPGLIGGLGKGLTDKVYGTFKDWVLSKVPGGGGSSANGDWVGNPGVEQFRPLVEKLLKEKGHPLSLTGSVLRRMNQESGGNPNAINLWDSNAAAGIPSKGLMQTIDPTFQAHMDPGHGNIWDPEDNLRASMNYAVATYGGLAAAYDRAGGYDNGGWLMPGTTLGINETAKPEPVFTNPQWTLIKSLVISTAELLDPIRMMAVHGRDAIRHIADIADSSRRQLDHQVDLAGAAVWAALPREVQDAVTIAGAVGAQWEKVSGYLNEKAIAWSKGEWPIGSGRVVAQEAGPEWLAVHLDESLEKVARSNMDLAEQVIAGKVSPGNDPVANALFDIFGRDPILPDLARIASLGPNAIEAATDAALHAFETGETARMEEWTASNSQLTEAVLRARDAAIVTGQMVQGAVNGYLNWAMASDSQGRQGSWQEYFQHYGGEYGTAQGDWLLSQIGFGGIVGGKFKDSFANLLIETAQSPLLSAPAILDDSGRVIGTQLTSETAAPTMTAAVEPELTELTPVPVVAVPDESIDLEAEPSAAGTKVTVEIPEGKTAITVDEFKEILVRIDERLDEVEIAIDGQADPAPLGLGVGGIV